MAGSCRDPPDVLKFLAFRTHWMVIKVRHPWFRGLEGMMKLGRKVGNVKNNSW